MMANITIEDERLLYGQNVFRSPAINMAQASICEPASFSEKRKLEYCNDSTVFMFQ